MKILEKTESGYRLGCDCTHRFMRKRLGLSVECPACGATETSAALLDRYTYETADQDRTEAA